MTTPAVNNDITVNRDSYEIKINIALPSWQVTNTYSRPYENRRRTRPSSTNHPLVKGWRQPGAYYTDVDRCILSPRSYSVDRATAGWLSYKFGSLIWPQVKPGFPSYPASMQNEAEIKALTRVKGQKVNLSVAFAEYRQTAELLSSSAKRIARSVENWRHYHPKAMWRRIVSDSKRFKGSLDGGPAAGIGHNLPESWLELQYGWNPLMQDLYGAVNALADKYTYESFRIGVSGTAKYHDTVTGRWINGGSSNPLALYEQELDYDVLTKVRLDYVVGSPFLRTMAQLGLTNPLEVVWEKLPYSFVIDWFVPVGSYLSVLDADLGLVFKGGTRTVVQRLRSSGRWSLDFNPSIFDSIRIDSHPVVNRMSMTRGLYTQSPRPSAPVLKSPISAGHIANAMSLLVSSFRHLR